MKTTCSMFHHFGKFGQNWFASHIENHSEEVIVASHCHTLINNKTTETN
jgi:hypothetical protein